MARIIEQKIYSFDELNNKSQERVIKEHGEFLGETWSYDFIYDNFIDTAKAAGFNVSDYKEISFSGFYSRASFVCDSLDLDVLGMDKELQKYIDSVTVARVSNIYSHERTCKVEYKLNDEINPDETAIQDFFYSVEQKRVDLCKQLYKDLQKDYEYQFTKECVIDSIKANGYEFYESGELYYQK